MHQLNELDASFLFLESETTPMHIGGVYTFDAGENQDRVTFEDFRLYLNKRLHLANFFRQKLMMLPFNLDRPYWVDDPEFDIDQHLEAVNLEGGSHADLMTLAEERLATTLPRSRPLWHVTWVDGFGEDDSLPSGGFALIVRVHHAAIDAFSGEEVMGKLLEYSADNGVPVKTAHWHPEPPPPADKLVARASINMMRKPFQFMSLTRATLGATVSEFLQRPMGRFIRSRQLLNAPRTPFNRNLTRKRRIFSQAVSLARLKSLKTAIGPDITLNDVVLGLCSETLTRYLKRHDAQPAEPLVALTPLSVRSNSLRRPTGNQMSAMLVNLATDEPDPAARIRLIRDNTRISENYQEAIAADRLTERLPSTMVALSTRLYTEFQIAQRYKPPFNLPITNVPGPQVPLYLQGARLVHQVNSAPLFHGAGLAILAVSYAGSVHFNLTLCPDLIPDGDCLPELILQSLDAIERSALSANAKEAESQGHFSQSASSTDM
ncbi:diacylglycerol O-acyltransferase [Halospina denitrificans]|uniref:diacylglycerol O-acyltransferase n=1 Tax=Halospina denitrificans TaxID=332522 RepID=A0A4R7JI01_9GAMM|nr:wax ester/triacylglycerol synthase family O-acyltransferase [Halospina denitrificans]TDT37104.1 diacylglycerol O-acyltransferase [Halospina denitrificans]